MADFLYQTEAFLISLMLLVGMTSMILLGNWIHRKLHSNAENLGTIEGSLFALLGLLLAFTFGMAGNRFDNRRQASIEEANAIGTAFLRTQLYVADSNRQWFKTQFNAYLDQRIKHYAESSIDTHFYSSQYKSDQLGAAIWKKGVELSRLPENQSLNVLVFNAFNEMLDSTTRREAAIAARIPEIILWLLLILALSCSFFAGNSMPMNRKINRISLVGFVLLTVIVVYVIMDLDRPVRGIINLKDQVELLKSLKQ